MLSTIESLEKDIARFHSNITSSNELMEILTRTVTALDMQTNAFEARSTKLLDSMKELPKETDVTISKSADSLLEMVRTENQRLQSDLANTTKSYTETLSNTETALCAASTSLEERLNAAQKAHSSELARITSAHEAAITRTTESYIAKANEYENCLEKAQTEFANRVEASHIDRIYPICQEMSHAIKVKLNLILCAAILAAICSLAGAVLLIVAIMGV